MATIRNVYEKRLDKSLQAWYNSRKKERVRELTTEALIKNNSVNTDRSEANRIILLKMATAIEALGTQERYTALRNPVIAGGAIRDTVFGLTPKDWDIFLDVSSVTEEEQEDFVLLYLHDLIQELRKDDYLRARLINAVSAPLGGQYGGVDDADKVWTDKQFIVCQTDWSSPDIEWPETPISIQTIGRQDARLTDDPVSFLGEFDYGAVKALFDPAKMDFSFHEDFRVFIDSKIIEVCDDKTANRVNDFRSRFWPSKPPFKIVDKRSNLNTFKYYVKTVQTADFAKGFDWPADIQPEQI